MEKLARCCKFQAHRHELGKVNEVDKAARKYVRVTPLVGMGESGCTKGVDWVGESVQQCTIGAAWECAEYTRGAAPVEKGHGGV